VRVKFETARFRVVAFDGHLLVRHQLQVRSGRLTGADQWLPARGIGDYVGFVEELGKSEQSLCPPLPAPPTS
jgi:hypothetical protein